MELGLFLQGHSQLILLEGDEGAVPIRGGNGQEGSITGPVGDLFFSIKGQDFISSLTLINSHNSLIYTAKKGWIAAHIE